MMSASSLMEASGYLEMVERTTPGPETPTLMTQSDSPTPWNAPAINGLSSGALQNTTSLDGPTHCRSAVSLADSRMISPIIFTASMLIPLLVEPTLTDEQRRVVISSASGMERIRAMSPALKPLCTNAE